MTTHADYQHFKGQAQVADGIAAAGNLLPTSPDILGPFYKAGAPFREGGRLAGPHDGKPLILHGTVRDTSGELIAGLGAVLDVWQANGEGDYDNDGFNYRGKVEVDL